MSKKSGYRHEYRFIGSKKHKTIALLLCVFGGYLGLHYFYVRRYWRGALNLLLLLALTIASSVFGVYYIRIGFGPTQGIFVHWREAVAVICAAIQTTAIITTDMICAGIATMICIMIAAPVICAVIPMIAIITMVTTCAGIVTTICIMAAATVMCAEILTTAITTTDMICAMIVIMI